MASLTIKQKIDVVNNFIGAIEDSRNSYYCFIGKPDPWINANTGLDDETAIPESNTSITQTEQQIYQNLVYAKKLTNTDVEFMTVRHNWVSNTIYAKYDNNDSDLYSKNFYVITDSNDVYKCLYNGYSPLTPNGVPSTVKPSVKITSGNFQTSDSYIWKYMYTCEPTAYLNFQTANYIPVTPNNAVVSNAVPGTIDNLVLINGGQNWQVFEEGFISGIVNNSIIRLPQNTAPIDNYYTNSSIYLKAGFGAGQMRNITSHSGMDKLISVNPPLNLYENLKLEPLSINGGASYTIGNYVKQLITNLVYFYKQGTFNIGDALVQPEIGAVGSIQHANSTTFTIRNYGNTTFALGIPVYNTSDAGVLKSGKVSVNTAANAYQITSNTSTNFTTDFAVNEYIRVGDNANNNLRRITSVNSTVIGVSTPLTSNALANTCYLINSAVTVDSVTSHHSEGSIVYLNLNSAQVTYANIQPITSSFIVGETLTLVDSANTSQNANGTLSFSNSSSLILSDVSGTIVSNLYLFGSSSLAKAEIVSVDTYPNITVETIYGGFLSGAEIDVQYANGVAIGNATVVSTYTSPDELTEYIISPSVTIEGDGNGALAYCTVDLRGDNPTRALSSIVLISGGQNYTQANVTISSNTIYGNGAVVQVQISPTTGHGSNAYVELGASYAGVYKKFDTGVQEDYELPIYGSYRNIGILKNPKMNDVILNLSSIDNSVLNISNVTTSFNVGEIVIQPQTNACGIVISSNSTVMELKNTQGTFIFGTANDDIYGLTSNSVANCENFELKYFSQFANLISVTDIATNGKGYMNEKISNTQIRLTDVVGKFAVGDRIFETGANTYANIVSIYTSNGTVNSSTTFTNKFNQTVRITLTSNNKPYSQFEYVVQDTSYATGKIISTADEVDVTYDETTAWAVGDIVVNDTTGGNGIITFANTSSNYLKIAGISKEGFNETTNRPFNVGDIIKNSSGTKTSTINNVYGVIILNDVKYITGKQTTPYLGVFTVNPDYNIVGNISGATGIATLENSIKLPDLVRESGDVIYLENLSKFDRTSSSIEQVKLIIKF